jgi:hypothetical protein
MMLPTSVPVRLGKFSACDTREVAGGRCRCVGRRGSLQGVASTAQGATLVGRAFTQRQERPQQRNYLRQHMCARDSRIPRLRRDNDRDGRADSEQFEFPVSVLSGN